ncbi:MAG: tRNA lysidine(34) synthetase TilS [Porticoccaceae bacterium]
MSTPPGEGADIDTNSTTDSDIDSTGDDLELNAALAPLREARHIYVGYSGGLDSHTLLHLICARLGADRVTALHINHQLSPNADAWQQHCQAVCDELGVACDIERVTVHSDGSGPEASARAARYQVFNNKISADDVLVLGHHADDQVETVLYRLLRGAGARGLAGIPAERALKQGRVLRPLLALPRSDLRHYAEAHKLSWIEDESNLRIDYDRNYLRHRVIPALLERWPNLAARVGRSASHSEQSEKLNADLAALDLAGLDVQAARVGESLSLDLLLSLPDYRQRNVLRHWCAFCPQSADAQSGSALSTDALSTATKTAPGHRAIEAVLSDLIEAQDDANPVVTWPGGEWRRFNQRLYCLPVDWQAMSFAPELSAPLRWQSLEKPLALPGGGELSGSQYLHQHSYQNRGQDLFVPPGVAVSVAFRQGGERCQPVARSASTTLKKLFQEYHLEPWLRDRIPLIYIDDELAAVGDVWVCEGFQAGAERSGWRLSWTPVRGLADERQP